MSYLFIYKTWFAKFINVKIVQFLFATCLKLPLALSGQDYIYYWGIFLLYRCSTVILFPYRLAMSVFFLCPLPWELQAELPIFFTLNTVIDNFCLDTHSLSSVQMSPCVGGGEKVCFAIFHLVISGPSVTRYETCSESEILCDYCFPDFWSCCWNFGLPQDEIRGIYSLPQCLCNLINECRGVMGKSLPHPLTSSMLPDLKKLLLLMARSSMLEMRRGTLLSSYTRNFCCLERSMSPWAHRFVCFLHNNRTNTQTEQRKVERERESPLFFTSVISKEWNTKCCTVTVK